MEQISTRKTTDAVFTNGMIELVIDPVHDGQLRRQLKLLFWKGEVAKILPRIKIDRKTGSGSEADRQTVILEPEDLNPTFLRAMIFPSGAVSFGSTQQLLVEICGVIKQFTDLGNDHALLAAHSVLASWFVDATDLPVSLVIYGPDCHQGQRLFRILSCLYRRALLVGEINLASLCTLPIDFSPSLFIERYDHSPQIEKVIRATRMHGYVPAKGKLISTRCATVIYSDEPLNGAIPDLSSVEIPVSRTGLRLPPLNKQMQQSIAETFQSKLLMYRLKNRAQVLNSTFDSAASISSVTDLVQSLGACVVDAPDRQADVVRLLEKKDKEVNEDCCLDLRVTVLEAMLSLCPPKKESVYVSEVAKEANSILERRGEWFVMTARSVGSKLRVMGLATGRVGAEGRGILLKREIQRRIHRLALENKLPLQPSGQNECSDCGDLRMERDDEELKRQEESDNFDLEPITADHTHRHNSIT